VPDTDITIVHRSDESGTTKLFTTFLAAYSPEWEKGPGVDKTVTIKVGLSKTFHEQAPELVAVLEKVNLPIDLLNQNLGRMAKERIESPKLAKIFLKEHPEVWHAWVSEDAAKKIDAAL